MKPQQFVKAQAVLRAIDSSEVKNLVAGVHARHNTAIQKIEP